jgi:hypothetical protein
MPEIQATNRISPISAEASKGLDLEALSYLIGCAKIRELELRLEDHFRDIETRLAQVKTLQRLKQKVLKLGDSADANKDSELAALLDEARALGLDWNKQGWGSKEERDTLLDGLHVQITSRESENQTVFMRVNRLMNLRSEAANLFSKIVADSHSQSIRILSRLDRKN